MFLKQYVNLNRKLLNANRLFASKFVRANLMDLNALTIQYFNVKIVFNFDGQNMQLTSNWVVNQVLFDTFKFFAIC